MECGVNTGILFIAQLIRIMCSSQKSKAYMGNLNTEHRKTSKMSKTTSKILYFGYLSLYFPSKRSNSL
jgi:hypothetical protein